MDVHSIATQQSTECTPVAGHSSQRNITQHGMLPQHPPCTIKLICDYFKHDFSKEYIAPLMMVLGPRHVGAFLLF